MKKTFSILLVLAMLISCFSMISFTANAAEDTNYVGKKITFTEDKTTAWVRTSVAGLTGYADGTHTLSYTVFNNGETAVRVSMFLQRGWDYFNSTDGGLTTIPAGEYATLTYKFTVTDGNIVGTSITDALSTATLRFDIKAVADGLGVIPAGTEIYIKYNGADDRAREINQATDATIKREDVTELPEKGKKVVSNTAVDHYLYSRLNAGLTSLVEGTHEIKFIVYNPNSYDIKVNFYLQNNWSGFSSTYATGTNKVLKAGTKEIFTATYTVTNGAVGTLTDATLLYVRLDVYNEKGNQTDGIPNGVTYYVQPYNDAAEYAYGKLTGVTHYYANGETKPTPTPSCTVSNVIFPDVDFVYKTVDNGDVENGTTNWGTFSGGTIATTTDTKSGTGNAIKFTPTANRWSTPTFQVQNAILQDNEASLGGSGAGTYIVTFDAKASKEYQGNPTIGASKQHKTAAQVAEICGGAASDYVQTYTTASTVTIGTEWNTYTSTFKISEKYVNTIKAMYNAGKTDVYQLDFRFDASNLSYKTEQNIELYLDNVKISFYEESSEPVGIVYTTTSEQTNPWLISKSSGNQFTTSDISDGKVTFKKYVFNESDVDLQFTFKFQVTDSNGWSTPTGASSTAFLVERNSGAWIEATVPVDANNQVATSVGTFDVTKLFIRFSFSGTVPAGIKFVLACDADEAAALDLGLSSLNTCFTKALTYDMKYTKYPEAGDKYVDPDFHVSGAFGDHMVLQRDRLVPVWGVSTDIGKEVTVTFAGQTKKTTVASDGKWTVTLDEMSANKTGQEMVITCNGKTQTLKDILIGDVFMVGGQSNAEKTLGACGTVYSDDFKTALVESGEGNIRFFRQGKSDTTVDKTVWDTPQYEPVNGNYWTTESVFRINQFSAIGVFFAHKLYDSIDVPVGMVMVASGGSPLSQLMSAEASAEANYTRYENGIPVSAMYNALMAPFINMSFKGMLFYQGESEMGLAISDYGKYNEYLKIYVEDLREKNGYDFSFYNVQLSSHVTTQWTGICEQRAVQFDGIKMIDNAGLVVSMDQGFRSTDSDFAHPNYKKPVGDRLGALALYMDYGIGDPNYVLSPEPVSAVKTDKGIVVNFKNVGDGLKRIGQHETLSGFRAMTGARTYVSVEAEIISKNAVLIKTNGVNGVIGVAYGIEELAFADYPEGNGDLKYVANLGNSSDLPCFTFKMTDIEEEKIIGAQTNIGADLTLNFHSNAQGEMKIYHEGNEITVNGVLDSATGNYVYMYEGINPQCMGDTISSELWVDGVKVDEKADYSIATYCDNIYNTYNADSQISAEETKMLNLLADMLDFGAEAQKHMGYKTDSLMNSYDWIEEYKTEFKAPESDKTATQTTMDGYKIKSAGLHIDNYISIYLKPEVASWENVSIKVNNGVDKIYTEADLVNGVIYLDDLTSTQYGLVHNIELQVNGTTVQTLTYSANSYIASKYNGANSGIVQAIGRYGASAKKLQAAN